MNNKKILFYDIETEPNAAFVWGTYEQNVIKFIKEGGFLCCSLKWANEDKVYFLGLNTLTPKQLAKQLWNFFNEADIIVAHNGDRFDIKKSNVFFLKSGLTPPSPYKTVDTKKEAKKHFMFNSNKLNDLGVFLGLGEKEDTGGFSLWEGCMGGDKKAWNKMERYNKQDILLLEKVYYKLLPWMNHPKVSFVGCPNCGSRHTQSRGMEIVSNKWLKRRHQCQDCGKWFYGEKVLRVDKLSMPIP